LKGRKKKKGQFFFIKGGRKKTFECDKCPFLVSCQECGEEGKKEKGEVIVIKEGERVCDEFIPQGKKKREPVL